MARAFGKARYPLIVILVIATTSLFIWSASTQRARARAITAMLAPTAAELEVALLRAGLGTETLTAAGLSGANSTTVVGDLRTYMTNNSGVLDSADSAYASPKQSVDQLKRLVQSGLGTAEDVTAYNAAKSNLATAQTQRNAVLDDFFTAGVDSLTQAQKDTLTAIRGNSDWNRPTEFLMVNHTDGDWVELRECLANERIAADLGEEPDADSQTILTAYRNVASVSTAKANLDANLAVVTAAWEQAIGQ